VETYLWKATSNIQFNAVLLHLIHCASVDMLSNASLEGHYALDLRLGPHITHILPSCKYGEPTTIRPSMGSFMLPKKWFELVKN
jgi:hypothetical protein